MPYLERVKKIEKEEKGLFIETMCGKRKWRRKKEKEKDKERERSKSRTNSTLFLINLTNYVFYNPMKSLKVLPNINTNRLFYFFAPPKDPNAFFIY